MTATQEMPTDTARRGQEATVSAMDIWADTVKKMFGSLTTPNAVEVVDNYVDNYFDFIEHMLANQREFAKSMMAVTTSAAGKAASAAQGAAKDMQEPARNAAMKKS